MPKTEKKKGTDDSLGKTRGPARRMGNLGRTIGEA